MTKIWWWMWWQEFDDGGDGKNFMIVVMIISKLFPLQISWVRREDVVILSHGTTVFTSDNRFSVSLELSRDSCLIFIFKGQVSSWCLDDKEWLLWGCYISFYLTRSSFPDWENVKKFCSLQINLLHLGGAPPIYTSNLKCTQGLQHDSNREIDFHQKRFWRVRYKSGNSSWAVCCTWPLWCSWWHLIFTFYSCSSLLQNFDGRLLNFLVMDDHKRNEHKLMFLSPKLWYFDLDGDLGEVKHLQIQIDVVKIFSVKLQFLTSLEKQPIKSCPNPMNLLCSFWTIMPQMSNKFLSLANYFVDKKLFLFQRIIFELVVTVCLVLNW